MAAKPQYEVAHIIQNNWDAILENPSFNTHQIRMLNAIRLCRTVALGWHLDECDHCAHLKISYNSCRNRHCPKCQGKLREDWISAQHEKLVPVKYFHVVFTIPAALNQLCLYKAEILYSILFKAAWLTIQTFAKGPQHLDARTGMTSILHTWGQNLSLHPHLHCIIPSGGMTKKGKWKQAKSNGKYLFPVKAMSIVFRANFVRLLRHSAKQHRLNISQYLYDELFEKNWVIYAKQPFLGPAQIIEYIGRYTHKIAISNHRIIDVEAQKVFFNYKDYRQKGKKGIMPMETMEFIRRFSLHILPHRFVRIRHFGLLNGRSRFSIQEVIEAIDRCDVIHEKIPASSLIFTPNKTRKHICPVCKKGEMLLMATSMGRDPPSNIIAFYKRRLLGKRNVI